MTATSFASIDPLTGAERGRFNDSTAEEVNSAAIRARQAFGHPDFRDRAVRADALANVAEALASDAEQVIRVVREETGLSRERLATELERTRHQLLGFADATRLGSFLETIIESQTGGGSAPDLRRMLVPLGPVANFTASNFPLAFGVPGGDTASAIAAGCPVIVKGHPSHPETSDYLHRLASLACTRAGLPTGAIGLIQGAGLKVSQIVVNDPRICACCFTGSRSGGRAIFELANRRPRPIPVYAEMGSINPLVVTPDAASARPDAIATAVAGAVTGSAGQLCTKPGVVFVPETRDGERFVAALAKAVDSAGPQVMLNERLREAYNRATAELERRPAWRVSSCATEETRERGPLTVYPAAYAAPARLVELRPDLLEERFGPCVLVLLYQTADELLEVLERLEGELAGTIHSEPAEVELARRLAEALGHRVGRLIFNGVPTGVAVSPAMTHSGPYPASTSPLHTSVGSTAVRRFLRPLTWQDAPPEILPPELSDGPSS